MTAPARFRQLDLERLFKAAKKADVRLLATIKPSGDIEARMLTEGVDSDEVRNPLDRLHGTKT